MTRFRPPPPSLRERVVSTLAALYPSPRSELNFSNDYELLVSVLLSAQCTDKKVNEVTPALFACFPTLSRLACASLNEVESIIRPVNYYRTKARHLIEMATLVETQFHGAIPREHAQLVSLPGVGNKTANVVLGELGVHPTFPVDTHVFRVSHRLGLASGTNVRATEDELRSLFEPHLWRPLHHYLILHGRRVCKAARPACNECPLFAEGLCPARGVTTTKDRQTPSKKERAR